MLTALSFVDALAANYPCSGSKGGVSHCSGALHVCNDGSISGSKKICSMSGGPAVLPFAGLQRPTSSDPCSCRSDRICTGPRGGKYCTSDSGAKSYVQR
ncbi:MAG: hypothetical protein EON56_05070 [Alphaproteobacteria bacterium]|nr:MAG: hypothetical protein EON56_05070 [Alphaproteobacteria bacterium]